MNYLMSGIQSVSAGVGWGVGKSKAVARVQKSLRTFLSPTFLAIELQARSDRVHGKSFLLGKTHRSLIDRTS